MKWININRIIAIMLLIVVLVGIIYAHQILNRDLISESERAMKEALARFISPEMKELAKQQVQTRILKEQKLQESIIFWHGFKKYSSVSTAFTFVVVALVLSYGGYYRMTTHRLKTRHSEIEYRGKLNPAIASGLVLAEQLESRMPEQALDLYLRMMQINQKQLSSILHGYGHVLPENSIQAISGDNNMNFQVPQFMEVLNGLSEDGGLTIGFTGDGIPVKATFENIYSCGIFGISRSGKTTGLYSIITQSLLVFPGIRYAVIDPHHKRNESLTAGLPKTHHFAHIDPQNFKDGVYAFVSRLNDRLETTKSYCREPLILLIDELPVLLAKREGHIIETALGIIAKEGAKVDVFCLIAGQDTRISGAGGDKDLLCSRIAYNMSKKQASYLFEDKATVDLHEQVRHAKRKGLCVFSSADNIPVIIQQPLCLKSDIEYVEQIVKRSNGNNIIADCQATDIPVNSGKRAEMSLHERVENYLAIESNTADELANNAKISGKDVSQWRARKSMTEERKKRIEDALKCALGDTPEKSVNVENTPVKTGKTRNVIDISDRYNDE